MYDIAIIGGGVSGLGAGIYSARFNLKTIIFDKNYGGLIKNTHLVENYPGFTKLTGAQLAKNIEDHARSYKEIEFKNERAVEIEKKDYFFVIKTKADSYEVKTIIFAIGAEHRKLNVPGERDFMNRGVSYCAICEAPLFRDKIVGVVGGGDSAVKEALLLSEHARKVYLIVRGSELKAEPINIELIEKNDKIEVITNTNVTEIYGRDFVEGVKLDTNQKELKLDGLFIEIGYDVKADIPKELGVKLNEKGEIVIDCVSRTNVEGIYAAGDCTNFPFKQAITGVAQGVSAAYSAYDYLKKI